MGVNMQGNWKCAKYGIFSAGMVGKNLYEAI
jgi:hypothetical protein